MLALIVVDQYRVIPNVQENRQRLGDDPLLGMAERFLVCLQLAAKHLDPVLPHKHDVVLADLVLRVLVRREVHHRPDLERVPQKPVVAPIEEP